MLSVSNVKVSVATKENELINIVCKRLDINIKVIKTFEISKKSIDARNKNDVYFIYSFEIALSIDEEIFIKNTSYPHIKIVTPYNYEFKKNVDIKMKNPPIVVGTGPSGLFAGLVLATAGLNPIIIERGKSVDERTKDVQGFWGGSKLDINSNVQFGEGGAGTFSDGKLTTGIKDIRCKKVFDKFVAFGAPSEILYLAKPHIGTDKLVDVVKNMREKIISLGGKILFSTQMTDLIIENNKVSGIKVRNKDDEHTINTENVIIAIGHSARDTFAMLKNIGVNMERKPFSVGVRIEHRQEMINKSQYGNYASFLPSADYKLNVHLKNSRSAYTFCMCPGGSVVCASSNEGEVVTNGMSRFMRDEVNANSALLVGVSPTDFDGDDVLGGMYFQQKLEKTAFIAGGKDYKAPSQLVGDFLNRKSGTEFGEIKPSYTQGVTLSDFDEIFPSFITDTMREAIIKFDKSLVGFAKYDAVLTGVETRSSSPVRILRGSDYQSNIKGLYPCGEGAGYAGGIVSAAVDGIRVAEEIIGGKQ